MFLDRFAMIQCFSPGCSENLTANAVLCENCKFFLCCDNKQCLARHEKRDCDEFQSSMAHCSAAKLLERALKYDWATVVEKTMEKKDIDVTGCWTTVFMLARMIGGHLAVQQLGKQRVQDEFAICVPDWKENGDYRHRDTFRAQCKRLAAGEENDFAVVAAKLIPGENYFSNSPDRKETCSYDHAFAVISLERAGQGERRALLVQSTKKTGLTATVVDRRRFWNDLDALVAMREWSEETTALYKSLFAGIKRNYTGRIIMPIVKAVPLIAAVCAVCARSTTPLHCARCKRAVYCSRACQMIDWHDSHSKVCQPTQLVYG